MARKCVIDNIVDDDNDDEVEPQSKRPRTESPNDSSVDAASTSKVWECFTEILHDCGATTDTEGGKKVTVDRYFSEPLIDHKKVIHTHGGIQSGSMFKRLILQCTAY